MVPPAKKNTISSSATSAPSFKAIGQKLEKSTKKAQANSQSSGILGWIGGLFSGKRKGNLQKKTGRRLFCMTDGQGGTAVNATWPS